MCFPIIATITCYVLIGELIIRVYQKTGLIFKLTKYKSSTDRASLLVLVTTAVGALKGLTRHTCSITWMERRWLHRPLPMFRHVPQTSLSFICYLEPVIRIPLPAGSPIQESRCDSVRQQSRRSSCCSKLDMVLTTSQRWLPWHRSTQTGSVCTVCQWYLYVTIYTSADTLTHSVCFGNILKCCTHI